MFLKFHKFLQSSSSLPHVQYYSLSGLFEKGVGRLYNWCHHSREKLETKHGVLFILFFGGLITYTLPAVFSEFYFYFFFTFHYSLPTPTLIDTPFKKLSKLREKQKEKQFSIEFRKSKTPKMSVGCFCVLSFRKILLVSFLFFSQR